MAKAQVKMTVQGLVAAVRDQPLMGANAAAAVIGVKPPNFRRYKDRLTKIPVEGSADVFVRSEVEGLARELAAGRAGDG